MVRSRSSRFANFWTGGGQKSLFENTLTNYKNVRLVRIVMTDVVLLLNDDTLN